MPALSGKPDATSPLPLEPEGSGTRLTPLGGRVFMLSKNKMSKNKSKDKNRHLRYQLRQQRREFSLENQELAAKNLAKQCDQSLLVEACTHIALYIANDSEINAKYILQNLCQPNQYCYLPALSNDPAQPLHFLQHTAGEPLVPNRYDILEPPYSDDKLISPEKLNLVFMPLVGFDLQGNRLGMGGGYYDRMFAFRNEKANKKHNTKLIGLAYDFQLVEALNVNDWDVKMDGVLTDKKIL